MRCAAGMWDWRWFEVGLLGEEGEVEVGVGVIFTNLGKV